MGIFKYGLDEAEIEHLRAANCTDEEINDLNRKRVQEQMDEDNQTAWEEVYEKPHTVEDDEDFKRIRAIMPDIHPAYIGFLVSSPYSRISKTTPDYQLKNLYDGMKRKEPDGNSELERTNKTMKAVYEVIDFDPKDVGEEIYNFSEGYKRKLMDDTEFLLDQNTIEDDAEADKLLKVLYALFYAESFLPVDRELRDAVVAKRRSRKTP